MMGVLPQNKSQASAAINNASDFNCRTMALVSRRNDSCVFHHQNVFGNAIPRQRSSAAWSLNTKETQAVSFFT
jgi:hypothetical protein